MLLQIISSRRILYTPPDPSGRPGTNWVLDELGRVCASQADPHPKLFQLSCYYNFHCLWQLKAFQLASALENLKPSITRLRFKRPSEADIAALLQVGAETSRLLDPSAARIGGPEHVFLPEGGLRNYSVHPTPASQKSPPQDFHTNG